MRLTAVYKFVAITAGVLVSLTTATAQTKPSKEWNVIDIATARSAITLAVGDDGRVYQLGFGAGNRTFKMPDKVPKPTYDRAGDRLDEFYPSAGNGFFGEPGLQVIHGDGGTATDLIYVKHQTTSTDDPNVSITRIDMKDSFYPLSVALLFKTYRDQDVIEQWTEIRNDETTPVTLTRFASASPIFRAKEYWLTQFHGYHMREAEMTEEKLTPGIKVLDSKLGVRAHQMRSPSFILSLNGAANEEAGEAIGGSLEWSGNFSFAFDVDWNNGLRVVSGINPFGAQYRLKPGNAFTTPAMLWSWSDKGKGQVSRNIHRWARKYGLRDGDKPRPVLLNNWEATYFKFDEKKLVSLIDGAKEIGADVFLLDDGWFGNKYPRENDRVGLGDWDVNRKKLPQGLKYLVDESTKRGVGFGIWLEPEMVSPKSELFELHPDWVLGQTGREPILGRSQRVLDLTRPEVRLFVFDVIDKTLKSAPGTRYIKWDSNAYAIQPGSTFLKPDEQTHVLINYQLALYDVMQRTAKAYPDVMMMLCSSGPARVDFTSLRNFHSFWVSDNTDPLKRVFIQWGFSHVYPAQALSAHVTDMGKRPMKFAIDVALSGAFGLDLDLSKHTPEEKKQLTAGVALYKNKLRDLVATADLYRLESPYSGTRSAINYVSADRSKAVLFVYQIKNAEAKAVRPKGLDAARKYRVTELNLADGSIAPTSEPTDGETLMRDGITPSCTKEMQSAVFEIVAE